MGRDHGERLLSAAPLPYYSRGKEMKKVRRILRIDVCNYEDVVCNIYDSLTDVSGAAKNVFITSERNGWKELSFTIPSVCESEEGLEENYRLQYLIAEYMLRTVETKDGVDVTDWYIINEPVQNHTGKSKNISVKAGHFSQNLKTKQTNLEFSDEEGNNVGTCEEILTTILDGTDWHVGKVAKFFEDDGVTEKVRTLTGGPQSNAFLFITDMCELFDAKPVFNGDRTVDILPINPFSVELIPIDDGYGYGKKIRLEDGQIPQLTGENVIEIHYDKESKGIKRTLNTENLVTKLIAYGSYGDYATGICDLKEISHNEYVYNVPASEAGTEMCIIIDNGAKRYFTIDEDIQASQLIYSKLDYASMSYVWNETTQRAYPVYETKVGNPTEYNAAETRQVQNNVDFLLNFTYYQEVGLMTDEMLQELAQYQRELPILNAAAIEASANFSDALTSLSNIGQDNTGFLKLNVKKYSRDEVDENDLTIEIEMGDNNGIIYRSDYNEKYPFTWHTAKSLKDNGDPTSGSPSIVWILHKTNPITFEMAYLKRIDDRYEEYVDFYGLTKTRTADYTYGISEGNPQKITLWANYADLVDRLSPDDDLYLFCTNGGTGSLGAALSSDEAAKAALESELKTVTLKHPVYFEDCRTGNTIRHFPVSSLDYITNNPDGYGWAYLYNPDITVTDGEDIRLVPQGELFFCYHKDSDNDWCKAYCGTTMPEASEYRYFYHTKKSMLWRSNLEEWTLLDPTQSAEYQRIGQAFATAWKYCLRRDEIYKGKNEYYIWTADELLRNGNYAMVNPYGFYWTFTTDREVEPGHSLRIDVANNNVYQDEDLDAVRVDGKYVGDTNSIVETQAKQLEVIDFPSDNELLPHLFKVGIVNAQTGVDENDVGDHFVRTTSIQVHDNTRYDVNLPAGSYAVLYDLNNNYRTSHNLGPNTYLDIPNQIGYIRIVAPKEILSNISSENGYYVQVHDYENTLFVDKIRYRILNPVIGEGTNKGINNLIAKYPEYADRAYLEYLPALLQAQQDIKDRNTQFAEIMHDTLKESRWQEPNYVDGDEDRLYEDAMDNSYQLGKPEATYDINFISLYESQGITEDDDVPFPDVDITDAAHIVDPEIDVNLWGYLDKVNKCYDKDWETTIEANTNLSTIAQHSFTDIMSYVADVAKKAKNRQSVWERAENFSPTGQLMADKLKGTIDANKTLISGASANWGTNEKGQMIFENENGLYAMMLSGAGLMIADSKTPEGEWNWKSSMTGAGLTADTIVFGEMSGQRIQAHTITADKVSANLGNELEIGSNVALTLYATKDGYRPAGSLDTQNSVVPKAEGDVSFIQILPAGTDQNGNELPARIYIESGGLTHISGSTLELEAKSVMDIKSGSAMNISAGGSLDIDVSGDDGNTGTLTINSTNFVLTKEGNVMVKGNINVLDGGNIAGIRIKDLYDNGEKHGTALYIIGGVDSMTSTLTRGLYLGTDGVNYANLFKVSNDGVLAEFGDNKLKFDAVNHSLSLNTGTIDITGNSSINISAGTNLTLVSGTASGKTAGVVKIGNNSKPFTIGSEGTGSTSRAFIYNGKDYIGDTENSGIYLGTDGIIVGEAMHQDGTMNYFTALPDGTVKLTGEITATSGKIAEWKIDGNKIFSGSGTNYVALDSGTSGESFAIWAGNASSSSAKFKVARTGDVTMTNATISGGSITIKDGSAVNFQVTNKGVLTAKKGTIANWTVDSTYIGSDATKEKSGVGLASGSGTTVVFWAGHTTTSSSMTDSNFYVTGNGYLCSKTGNIGGWYVGTNYIGNANTLAGSTVGMFSASGTSFWAGKTQSDAPFRVTNGGHLTTTSATIGNWTLAGGTLTRTSSATDNVGDIVLGGGTYAIEVYTKSGNTKTETFTVKYNGTLNATKGKIAGWQINDNKLYKAVDGKGKITLGDATTDYAINVNNKFTVKWDGTVTMQALSVDGQSIDFSSTSGSNSFSNAISISGAWDGTNFKVTARLKNAGTIAASESLSASFEVTQIHAYLPDNEATGQGKARVAVKLSIGGKKSSEMMLGEPVDADVEDVYRKCWEAGYKDASKVGGEAYNKGWNACRATILDSDSTGTYYSGSIATKFDSPSVGATARQVIYPFSSYTIHFYDIPDEK